MTKVRATLPWESGLGQKTFFITLGGPQAHDSSGRKTSPGRGVNTEISPLRFASVEMTKVRATLPWESGLGQKTFFITLGGPQVHDSSGRKTSPGRGVNTEISPLRFASVEMTKVRATLP
jgi:hypothetical protein